MLNGDDRLDQIDKMLAEVLRNAPTPAARRLALDDIKEKTRLPLKILEEQMAAIQRQANGAGADTIPDAVRAYNDDHIVVKTGNSVVICQFGLDFKGRRQTSFIGERGFELLQRSAPPVEFAGQFVNPAKAWLQWEGRPTYPNGFVIRADGADVPTDAYNLWEGFAVAPQRGDWQLLRRHLTAIICNGDEDHAKYLLKWCAWVLKNPDKKPGVNLALRGDEGAGKGVFLKDVMHHIFGAHGLYIGDPKTLTAEHNEILLGKLFVFADEAVFAGSPQAVGLMKSLATEDELVINPKHVSPFPAPNQMAISMATNMDHMVNVSRKERRNFGLKVSDAVCKNVAYFDALYGELNNGGREAFLHEMLDQDVTQEDIRHRPTTSEIAYQAVQSMRGIERWLYDHLAEGQLPGMKADAVEAWKSGPITVKKSPLFNDYEEWHKTAGYLDRGPAFAKNAFFRKLYALLPNHARPTRPNKKGERPTHVELLALHQCREAFQDTAGKAIWLDDDGEYYA